MSFLRRAVEHRYQGDESTYGLPGNGQWGEGMVWQPWASGSGSGSAERAMRISAVFACLRLLSEAIATLPLDTFIRRGGDRLPYRPRPAYLNFTPPHQSRIVYLSQLMLSMLTDGNAFILHPRDALGVPTDLIVMDPAKVTVSRDRKGHITYRVANTEFDSYEMTHIMGMLLPGALRGLSPLAAARETVEGGVGALEYGRNFLGNLAVPPAVLELPTDTSDEAAARAKAQRVKAAWNESHAGPGNAGRIGVLLGGAKLSSIAVNPEDAQWLDSRKFGVSEIARFFGVPPHLIADATGSTSWGSGLAQQNQAFGAFSIRPWVERIEDAHGRLLTSHGMPDVFVKLNVDALLRADTAARFKTYAEAISSRIMTPNECRRLEDLPPLAGGDEFPPVSGVPADPATQGGTPAPQS